jgi:hypothetical protein
LTRPKVIPFRQKEPVAEVSKNFAGQQQITGHDIQCVRRAQSLDQIPTYSYLPKFGSRQYSEAFRDWLLGEYAKDKEFFAKARQAASANTPPAKGEK